MTSLCSVLRGRGPGFQSVAFFVYCVSLLATPSRVPRRQDQGPGPDGAAGQTRTGRTLNSSSHPGVPQLPLLPIALPPAVGRHNLRGELVGPVFHDNAPSEKLLRVCVGILILICDRYSKTMQTKTYRYGPKSRGSVCDI